MNTPTPLETQRLLFSTLLTRWKLKSYRQLSSVLGVAPPALSKMINGRIPVGATMILAIHEEDTSLSIKQIKEMIHGTNEFHAKNRSSENGGNSDSADNSTT